jgi:hypothetical protein
LPYVGEGVTFVGRAETRWQLRVADWWRVMVARLGLEGGEGVTLVLAGLEMVVPVPTCQQGHWQGDT